MDTATCRHCGHTIVLGPPSPDPYWYHPRGQSVYCDLRYVEPRYMKRAEPKPAIDVVGMVERGAWDEFTSESAK